jgi:hypothetical protein
VKGTFVDYYDFRIASDVLDYMRKIFGLRPYDEVAPVIQMFEQGRREQDEQRTEQPHILGNGHDTSQEQRQ